jgi:hypothetical protein
MLLKSPGFRGSFNRDTLSSANGKFKMELHPAL